MSIIFNEKTKTFYLNSKSSTYVFKINAKGYLEHLYYGDKIPCDALDFSRAYYTCGAFQTFAPGEDSTKSKDFCRVIYHNTPSELSFWGNGDYREPTVLPECENGDRMTELLYESHEILNTKPKINGMPSMDGNETLIVHLKDKLSGFCADLYYSTYPDCNAVARRIVYKNCGDKKFRLNRAYSFNLPLESQNYDVISLRGAWGMERRIQKTPLKRGAFVIDSKRNSSSATMNPFMALTENGSTEDKGNVYGISLIYSSSFVLKAEGNPDGSANITGGINDFAFSWALNPNEIFETPEVILAYSNEGLGGMSRELHDAARNHLINKRFSKSPRPIVINNWEGTTFNFDNDKLISIADAVKGTGIDTFVLDDGWFGKRDDDRSGLGDWFVNEKKMKGGLKPVIDHVNSIGMKFGLWFEPEMINEDSDIFRAHPEYAIGVPDRPRCYGRHQFLMDLTREDTRDYIVSVVNKVLKENNIEYVKWDYNRNTTEFFSSVIPADRQGEFTHRYILGFYDLCERIVEANPDIFFEGCSGGGGRFDYGVLHYFPQIWTSDDSDAEERTLIQYGTSIAYPLSAMSCHTTAIPNHQSGRITDFETRSDIAHLGSTGYELDTSKLTDEEKVQVKYQVEEYKEMQDLVLLGDLYRVANPFESNHFGYMLVSKDKKKAMMTVYRRMGRPNEEFTRFKANGLSPDKNYFVPEFNQVISGAVLMNVGFVPEFAKGDFKTLKYHFIEK